MNNRDDLFADFLCHRHGVKSVGDINPYSDLGNNAIPIWKPAQKVTITTKLTGKGVLTIPPQKNSQNVDLNIVSIKTFVILNVENPSKKVNYVVKRTYYPVFAEKELTEKQTVATAMGKTDYGICNIPTNVNMSCNLFVVQEHPQLQYLKEPCIKTFMFMTEERLKGGIIMINGETTTKLGLPKQGLIFDEKGQDFMLTINHYYLVPYGHVLSWPLQTTLDYRRKSGIFALEYRTKKENGDCFILYYIVADQCFQRLYNECVQNFINKIDKRPLSTVGLEIIPDNKEYNDEPPPTLTVSLTYIAYPLMKSEIPPLIPTLAPNFYPYQRVLSNYIEHKKEKEELKQRLEAQKKK